MTICPVLTVAPFASYATRSDRSHRSCQCLENVSFVDPNVLGMSRRAHALRSVYLLAFCSVPLLGKPPRTAAPQTPEG